MLTGMGVADPKLAKGGRKFRKAKHCTIPNPNLEQNYRKRASELEKLNLKQEVEKENSIVGNL